MLILCFFLAALLPYLICGFNPAIMLTKFKSGGDIREQGSGNAGLTNALRTQGKLTAAAVLFLDVSKGVLAVISVRLAFLYLCGIDTADITNGMNYVGYLASVFGVLGHVFPVYYGFKGGKGVLVAVSVLYAVDWISATILISIFAIIVAITRYVSLGSVIAGSLYFVCVLILSLIREEPTAWVNCALSAIISLLVIVMHRENIKRLRAGTEKKLGNKG
ncbi:MAG: glycerol-3-phosphate 1-O-acyltransferase PlsY [Oscillospiraceae bacterium]|nr:glycerol-3-phosphate 1-O-acyltransferase PlsY [Oscillospiraceae bacterium]